ncbi:MAG: leucine--tRNA ligase [Chitinophagaceae bacterium]|nr:MAG: leucine--tRNA ligase [Chitinophagaceae bacterium]
MEYNFRKIEAGWQKKWKENNVYKVSNDSTKPKYYVLDMFPYPSGAGLHVGHPLGYIASDIYSRYKRLKGFNVLHPMGFDSFGLPAEQYAIETGQHPADTTQRNIETFKSQLDKIGFCYDWDREVRTSDPGYYKWTQWIFLKLFNSYFCNTQQKARPISDLVKKYETSGSKYFSAKEWNDFDEKTKSEWLMKRRLAFISYGEVNWCEALGTVLANDEVVNGVSERGGHSVVKKKMRQWYLRITAYADRLLQGLETVNFSDAMKEMQRNWIGKSEGAEMDFAIAHHPEKLKVYTTRPDTIFGVDFMVMAPEHELVKTITTDAEKDNVDKYITYVKSRSDRERMSEVKQVGTAANPTKEATLENSDFLNGMLMKDAIGTAINKIEELGIGKRKVNFKMRDAGFSRQRYWGEPFPIKWENGVAVALREDELPVTLPHVEKYGPGPEGEGPLANIESWREANMETSTMPGYAGSSWYFLRYMDPHNDAVFCDRKVSDYWNQVDVYIGGTEHAVGHLLYSRMWTKVLYDLGLIGFDEPFKRLVNQGMIQGSSRFVYRITGTNQFVSAGKKDEYEVQAMHVDVSLVDGVELDIERFKKWKPDFADAEFVFEDGTFSLSCTLPGKGSGVYICGVETEKMSKSKYNTVNPDELCAKYGADTFRMYEMFLGPVEQSKPWDTKGIEGVHRFLRKLWRLFNDELKGKVWNDEKPTDAELKILHSTIKKIEHNTETFSFNTAVSAFMVCVNELADAKCHKKEVLEQLLVLMAPYAPHIAEELWSQLGNAGSILDASYPALQDKYLVETSKEYPVSINGKMRTTISLALDLDQKQVEELVLQNDIVQKWLEGNSPKKIIFVKGKMINVVL